MEKIMLFTLRGKKRMQQMMTVASDAGEQVFIGFIADDADGRGGVHTIL